MSRTTKLYATFADRRFLWGSLLLGGVVGCGSPPPPKPAEAPESPVEADEPVDVSELGPEEVETGKDCATAMSECDLGVCTVTVKNGCSEPVTCELSILSLCRDTTTTGEAKGVGRDTVAAGASVEIQAGADCDGREVVGTTFQRMSCK